MELVRCDTTNQTRYRPGSASSRGGMHSRFGDVPTFVDVEDVDSIYRLISDGRDRARSAKAAF